MAQNLLKKYLIDEKGLKTAQDEKALEEAYKKGKNLQDLFGFSNEVMLDFYEAAVFLYQEKRFEDALAAFTFLCNVNPGVPCFFRGKGLTLEGLQDLEYAEQAFKQGILADPANCGAYAAAVRFFIENKDLEGAKEWISYGRKTAESLSDEEEKKNLKVQLAILNRAVRRGKF